VFGVWIGKLVLLLLTLLRKRATSLPGKLALKVSPKLLDRLGRQLDRCIVVTGTNGKTTTARLISSALQQQAPVIHNTEGANLPQGLATALLRHTTWFGRLRRKTALFEIDEATLPLVADKFPIKVAAVTNVFRDQLDRYGELDTTLQKLLEGLRKTDAVLVLNGDDPLARYIGLSYGKSVVYFGMAKQHLRREHRDQMRDGAFCLQCGHELHYEGFFYGQLGVYRCPNCDFFAPVPDFVGSFAGNTLQVQQGDLPVVSFSLPVRGIFNVYNALCAVTVARVCGLDAADIARGFANYRTPLGRMQSFATKPASVLNLIKNPTGCDSVLQAILAEPGPKVLCVAINDLAADGKDVSWLWDADFELIAEDDSVRYCVTTGLRAEDMALRLKYAGVPTELLESVPDLGAGLDRALEVAGFEAGSDVYVLSTYTALYPMADLLKERIAADEPSHLYRASVS
jgi:lipid II isoglutaminyl synthase (glutamine-hydrolysing)